MSTSSMKPRLEYARLAAELFQRYLSFNNAFRMDHDLALLVDIRASQLNGCAFCLDMHVKQARTHGERELRLHHVAVWRESSLFTPKERAALAWTEALTRIDSQGLSDELYAQGRSQFSEAELAELAFRVASINGWNRLNVAFRTPPGSKDQAFGLDKAGLV